MQTVPYEKPLPQPDALSAPFWENAHKGKLSVQACEDCGDRHFPPTPVCPHCLSSRQSWQAVSGRGTLLSWTVFHRAYWPAFQHELPYAVCLVRLEEGPVLVSNFASGEPTEGLAAGRPVEAVFEKITDEVTLPKFRLVPA
jgi:uncharacterized OB-fold protein